jgi:hypothetical protein
MKCTMSHRVPHIVVVSSLVFMIGADVPTADVSQPQKTDIPARLDLNDVLDGIRMYYSQLRALEVHYDERTRPIHFDGELYTNVAHHFAYKGEKRLNSLIPQHESPDSATGYVLASNENRQENYRPQLKMAFIEPGKQPMLDIDGYALALGIPLTDQERATSASSSYFMPFALDTNKWFRRPKLESIDGADCYVLESQKGQVIWVDPAIGWAMRLRELHSALPDRPVTEWPLDITYHFQDFEKSDETTWLPKKVLIANYVSTRSPSNLWNQLEYLKVLEVKESPLVNDKVSDKLFTLSYPPGTEVFDSVSNRHYRIGSANEELDIVIHKSTDILKATGYRGTIFIILNLAIVLLLIMLVAYRMVKKRHDVH